MSYELVLTDRAGADLEEAYRWYAERSPERAARWYNGFLEALGTLATNPQRCGLAPENARFPFEVRQLIYGKHHTYRALFTMRQERVVVLHVRHTARRQIRPEELP